MAIAVIESKVGCRTGRDPWSGYGSYSGDKVVEWVCDVCWAKGVRTDLHLKTEKERKEKGQG